MGLDFQRLRGHPKLHHSVAVSPQDLSSRPAEIGLKPRAVDSGTGPRTDDDDLGACPGDDHAGPAQATAVMRRQQQIDIERWLLEHAVQPSGFQVAGQ